MPVLCCATVTFPRTWMALNVFDRPRVWHCAEPNLAENVMRGEQQTSKLEHVVAKAKCRELESVRHR